MLKLPPKHQVTKLHQTLVIKDIHNTIIKILTPVKYFHNVGFHGVNNPNNHNTHNNQSLFPPEAFVIFLAFQIETFYLCIYDKQGRNNTNNSRPAILKL